METVTASQKIIPPWNQSGLFSEEALREAQEYYFQTHATNSRLIAEGRSAQGFMKSFARRKLAREIGEDFRMYTGTQLGEDSGDNMESAGIRGEINAMLAHIYHAISPTQPIISPIQEDLTILKHPQGALEVCYAMTFFYSSLLKKYASLAGNRRQVLKNIMDEELFKWVWRLTMGYLLSSKDAKTKVDNTKFCSGLSFVP